MDAMRADGGAGSRTARAIAALVGVGCTALVLSPVHVMVIALAVAVGALAFPRCRMAAVEALAGIGFMAFMFGPAGAGGFVLMQALVIIPFAVALRGARPVTALVIASAAAGVGAACAAAFLAGALPTRWAAFAPMAAPFALAAPALALRAMAVALLGPARAETQRLNALALLLVALVVGAGVGGLHGAAVGWAAGQLAIPLAMLVAADRRAVLAQLALGVLAAGFMATLATAAALNFAHASPIAAAPAMVLGLMVWGLALHVHAPAAARHFSRVVRAVLTRVVQPPPRATPMTERQASAPE